MGIHREGGEGPPLKDGHHVTLLEAASILINSSHLFDSLPNCIQMSMRSVALMAQRRCTWVRNAIHYQASCLNEL